MRALEWPANLFAGASENLAGAWRFCGPLLPLGPARVTGAGAGACPWWRGPLMLVPRQATFARLTIRRRRGSLVWRFRQAM